MTMSMILLHLLPVCYGTAYALDFSLAVFTAANNRIKFYFHFNSDFVFVFLSPCFYSSSLFADSDFIFFFFLLLFGLLPALRFVHN